MAHFAKPAEGSWTEHSPHLGTAPVDYRDSIDPEWFEDEREAVFKRSWLNVGRIEQLPRVGSYFTREIDFASLRPSPWYQRYPEAAWRVFQALAYRLSPARRVLFAIAVPVLALGWLRAILTRLADGSLFGGPVLLEWVLAAGTLMLFLLVIELRDKLMLKGDLEIARQIQFGLLPFEPYRRPGVEIEAAMRTANTVGGDICPGVVEKFHQLDKAIAFHTDQIFPGNAAIVKINRCRI